MSSAVEHEVHYKYVRGEGTQAICLCGWVGPIYHSAKAAHENADYHLAGGPEQEEI